MRTPISDAGPSDALAPFRFSLRTPIEVADTDFGGVVYYGRYAHLIDRAVVAHRAHLGMPPEGPVGHLFVVRRLTVDYLSSAVLGDRVEAFVRASALGRSSHSLEVEIRRIAPEPTPIVRAALTIVGLSSYGGRPSRMPDAPRRAIAAFEGLEAGA